MSTLDVNFKSSASSILVDKILEQGQRLRNSMVQAVLNNDPFNQEILHNPNVHCSYTVRKNVNSLKCTCNVTNKIYPDLHEGIDKYIRRENLYLNKELDALDTRRSASPINLKQSTSSLNVCHCKNSCDICKEYENRLYSQSTSSSVCSTTDCSVVTKSQKASNYNQSHSQRTERTVNLSDKNLKFKRDEQQSLSENPSKLKTVKNTFYDNQHLLKYVDSLKINIYSLKLNNAGNRKVVASESVNNKLYVQSANSYFIEYTLPEFLTKNVPKTRSRVNSSLYSNFEKKIRYCTKKSEGDKIYFRQQAIHPVSNINMLDLSNINIIFNVSYRSPKQRLTLLIGKASFNLGSLIANRYLSCEQELVLMNENAPVALGTVKVSLQFGCDKLYFGKEFIDAIRCSKENSNLSENDSIHKIDESELIATKKVSKVTKKVGPLYRSILHHHQKDIPTNSLNEKSVKQINLVVEPNPSLDINDDINLLYALIFISEVRILSEPVDSYVICRGFSRDDTITSRTIYNDCNPFFNLYQTIPVLIDENFVNRLRDNYIIVDVWEQKDHDNLLGICKLPTHQFYVAYRNPAIVKHLARSPHPVIAVDWWEPIVNPITNSEIGQIRSLVALGTLSQIESLEQNRGLKNFIETLSTFKSKSVITENCYNTPITSARISVATIPFKEKCLKIIDEVDTKGHETHVKTLTIVSEKFVQEPEIEIPVIRLNVDKSNVSVTISKVDASTQSETKMDSHRDKTESVATDNSQNQRELPRDLLSTFLEQLITARDVTQRNRHVENSTNTEDCLIGNTRNSPTQNFEITTPSTVVINDTKQIPTNFNLNSEDTFPLDSVNNIPTTNLSIRNTSDLLDSLQKALCTDDKTEENLNDTDDYLKISDKFKAHIVIESALHLPSRKKCKSKRNKAKTSKQSEEILPSTYVTFKGLDSDFIVTPVVPKSTSPRWDYRNDIYLPTELLFNNQKRLIFKVWRKANGPNLQPNFQTDIVLGFAALDLTVLLSGLPNVQGWFNIVDFSSKCNGQIKIHLTPLENLLKFSNYKKNFMPEKLSPKKTLPVNIPPPISIKSSDKQLEAPDDSVPSELFSRALKRKFTELDEITQRLRQRLSAVTNDDFDSGNDDFIDEFERDLNTVCGNDDIFIETDTTKTINFEQNPGPSGISISKYNLENANVEEPISSSCIETARSNTTSVLSALNAAKKLSGNEHLISYPSEVTVSSTEDSEDNIPTVQSNIAKLDSHLTEGKLKIDSLLEKLTLLTNETVDSEHKTFSSRYVSGCSESNYSNINTSEVLRDIGLENHETIDADLIFNPQLFQQMFMNSVDSTPRLDDNLMSTVHCTTLKNLVDESPSTGSTSDLQSVSSTSTNISRQAPDGAGNISNDTQH